MQNPPDRPGPTPGIYTLITELTHEREIRIGALGSFPFPSGFYAYTGSAMGPGGLRARLGRHIRPAEEKSIHWHIDYLLTAGIILNACWTVSRAHTECEWAERIAQAGSVFPQHFGASDCGCPGHLVLASSQGLQDILHLFLEPDWEMLCIDPGSDRI